MEKLLDSDWLRAVQFKCSSGSRDGAVVRTLASHQCVLHSIHGPGVICGLSLLLVLFSARRGFSPGTPVFPSPQKPTFLKFQFDSWMHRHFWTSSVNSLVLRGWTNYVYVLRFYVYVFFFTFTFTNYIFFTCKLYFIILDYNWLKDNNKFSKPMVLRKTMTKILCGNFEKSFLEWEKMASRKVFQHFLHANLFMFILLISKPYGFSRSIWN